MRNRYIRFFISSTFVDMELERNLLQDIFDSLSKEYNQKGWQIETIDLRWGISNEAGLDNKTMQICKEELTRCQKLSPKPNFIILLGNRYGWIPLPETIPYNYWKTFLRHDFSESGERLFNRWYKFDTNALPSGEFVLQPRIKDEDGDYREKEVWEKYVEKPLSGVFQDCFEMSNKIRNSFLSKLFPKNWTYIPVTFYGLSATELEIQQGALSVKDANEHVVAYIRNLTDTELCNLSADSKIKKKDFLPENEEKIETLKEKLYSILSKMNVFEKEVSLKDYLSAVDSSNQHLFCEEFKTEMEARLRRVIENTINSENFSQPLTENQIHQRYAETDYSEFIGRKNELAYIDAYIQSSTNNKPKWIKAKSGVGKSALMAHIANSYKNSHHVICRFCGHTQKSARTDNLISSIMDDFQEISKLSARLESVADYVKTLNSDKPVLLIIDALDQVVDVDLIRSLDWLFPYEEDDKGNRHDIEFPQKVKVILSSLETIECTNKKHTIDVLLLGNMDIYSFDLAYSRVKLANRRLSSIQRIDLQQTIEKSDKSALYLYILGTYLSRKNDKEDLSALPTDTNGVVSKILEELERQEKHGAIVKEVLSMLAIEELTDKEITTLLAENTTFYQQFKDESHHEWNDHGHPSVPPVLWSRLKHDIQPFLRVRLSDYGLTNAFFHNGIKEIIKNRYLKNKDYKFYYGLLYQHFQKTWSYDSHALSRLIHYGCLYAGFSFDDERSYNKTCDEIHSYMHDEELIKRIIEHDPNGIQNDVREVLKYVKGQCKEYLEFLQVSDLKRLPASNFFRKIVDENSLLSSTMEDSLANSQLDGLLHIVPSLLIENYDQPINTTRACLSNNGEIVAYIKNGKELVLEDVTNPSKRKSYSWGKNIIEIQCSDDMRYLAVREDNQCFKFDTATEDIVESYPISGNGWMSMSGKGDFICEGNKQSEMRQAMWAVSGNVVWAKYPNGTFRYYNHNLSIYNEFSIELKYRDGKDLTPSEIDEFKICDCSDNVCICANSKSFIVLRLFEDYFTWSAIPYGFLDSINRHIDLFYDIFKISPDEHSLLFFNSEGNNCFQFLIDDEKVLIKQDEFCSSISCINNNSTKFLSYGYIYDTNTEIQKYNCLIQVRADGVKDITSNNNGTVIGVHSRSHWDTYVFMELIYNCKLIKWYPPFSAKDYYGISAVAVAPNGKYIAASTLHKDQFTIFNIEEGSTSSGNTLKFKNIIPVTTIGKSCFTISISEDSNYIVAADGEKISIISQANHFIERYDKNLTCECEEKVRISSNNRFLYIEDICVDIVSKIITKFEHELDIYAFFGGNMKPVSINAIHPNPDILLHPTGYITISSMSNHILLEEGKLMACSLTGRFFFICKECDLHIVNGIDGTTISNETFPLNIEDVIPAYDEDHVFVLLQEIRLHSDKISYYSNSICLYNIKEHRIEQQAQTSNVAYALMCAKGIVIAQQDGTTYLFSPSQRLGVNKPAVTTFVRRWNLETRTQEEPSAICPICGGKITITPSIHNILIDNPQHLGFDDWDKAELFGHHCPHCNAELRYNPNIY